MRELAVHLIGDRALLEHDDHVPGAVRHRRDVQVDQTFARITRRSQINLVFVDRSPARAHLLDERQQGAAERNELA